MPQLDFSVSSDVVRTPRVMQVEALFDAPAEEKLTREWHMTVPLEEQPWQIGLIVGPSGSGKSTTARHMFGDLATITHEWSPTGALVDDFPAEISIKDVTKLLGSVGLGTVPAWLRPYSTLSTGEQFRADVAHALAVHPDLAVIDEWTSTVDRHVAQVASHTAAKTVRRRGGQLVAVTCHYDVLDWLQPDWILEPHTGDFTWRSVQPRPHIDVDVYPVDRAAWRVFAPFHYLSARMPNGGEPFGAFIDGQCVGFALVAGTPHRAASAKKIRRTRRLVVLPDWQGLGIGIRFQEELAAIYTRRGFRFRSLTAHPGMLQHYHQSPRWIPDKTGINMKSGAGSSFVTHQREFRMLQVRGFTYQPPAAASPTPD